MDPVVFRPPLYQQRYQFVKSCVDTHKPKKVADLGCSECSLLHTLRFWECIELLVGLDIDEEVLKRRMHTLTPLPTHYLEPRKSPLTVILYHGSVTQKDPALLGFDLITCIELIEHLEAEDLETLQDTLFGFMAPCSVIISTPNADFNILLPKSTAFRHPDHKFEWSRKEFQSWAMEVAERFNYTVEFNGVGKPPAEAKEVGFCSQIGLFTRNYTESEETIKRKKEYKSVYKIVLNVMYPSLQEEKYLHQAVLKVALFHANCIKTNILQRHFYKEESEMDQKPYMAPKWPPNPQPQIEEDQSTESFLEGDTVYIPLKKLLCIPKVKELCENVDVLREIIRGEATLSSDGNAILYHVDLENDFDFTSTQWSM
ncbi:small RNA 2'-O-methyltransferase [Rhinophrynus dorsalis]